MNAQSIEVQDIPEIKPVIYDGPEALIARAIDRGVNVETMERLLAMRKELKGEAAREAYFQALSAFQGECPAIPKTKQVYDKGGQLRYRYAPIEVIVKTAGPYLEKHGFSYRLNSSQEGDIITAVCEAHHISGHVEMSQFSVPLDSASYMNAPQKVASARTFATRYALCEAFGIVSADEDNDANSIESVTAHEIHHDPDPSVGPQIAEPDSTVSLRVVLTKLLDDSAMDGKINQAVRDLWIGKVKNADSANLEPMADAIRRICGAKS